MRDVKARGAEWFRGIYARHYPDVVRYGLRRLDGLTAAEELAQEVFLVAWRRRSELPARTLPWLYGGRSSAVGQPLARATGRTDVR